MVKPLPKLDARRADFGDLREAYIVLSEIFALGGMVERQGRRLKVTRLNPEKTKAFQKRIFHIELAVSALLFGSGEKKSLSGKEEVVLSVIASLDGVGARFFDICALRVKGRSLIVDSVSLTTKEKGWQKLLRDFADWSNIEHVICAADGNNQRASIGAVLTMAQIGKGSLSLVEMEVPQEIDESTHLVRGAEWMKAGLPRFMSSASEAIWYLIRARSLHSRMFRVRKQGLYTSLAFVAFVASGASYERIADKTGLSVEFVKRLGAPTAGKDLHKADKEYIETVIYKDVEFILENRLVSFAANRIWRGPAIYLRGMNWRILVSQKARKMLGNGEDLVVVSEHLRIQRRELVRLLSQSLNEMNEERDRFCAAIPHPLAFGHLLV